jgi:hypothetical protein
MKRKSDPAASLPPIASAPSLLLFYHIPKTGGSTIREWLLRNGGARTHIEGSRRLSGVVRYYEAQCFMCLQFGNELLGAGACPDNMPTRCDVFWGPKKRLIPAGFNAQTGDWRTAGPLAVEFHGASGPFFMQYVLPAAQRLRRLYHGAAGRCKLATVIREPTDLLFSTFYMWPPRIGTSLTPFPEWLRTAHGLQAGYLTSPSCTNSSRGTGLRNLCGCDAVAEASRTLARFDLVGVTSCLSTFLDDVEDAMRFAVDPPLVRLARRAQKGNASAGPMHSVPRCTDGCSRERPWTPQNLDAAGLETLARAAQCDRPIFRIAARRAYAAAATLGEGGAGTAVRTSATACRRLLQQRMNATSWR